MKFNADIFGTKTMNPSYFGDPLDFLLELNHQVKILVYDLAIVSTLNYDGQHGKHCK